MKGEAIIERAREHFGETTALTVLDTTLEAWVNNAATELYGHLTAFLPSEDLRPWVKEGSVSLTDGEGTVDGTWDRIVNVKDDGAVLLQVAPETISLIDTNPMWETLQGIWAEREKTLWVRPTSVLTVDVARLAPPDTITDFSVEVTEVHSKWHEALVWLVTSYAYAQEEDLASSDHYRGRYLRLIGTPERTPEGGQNS